MNLLWDALFAPHEGSSKPFLWNGTTYGDVIALAARYAHLLTEHGLKPRDRLAVQVEKSPELLALYAACVQTGIVFVPLDPASTPAEAEYFVSDSAAAMLVGDPAADKLPGIARHYGAKYLTLAADGSGTLRDLSAGPSTFPTNPRAAIDLAAVTYTAGTTGRPRGAMLTHGNLLSNAQALARCWRATETDVLLHPLPMFDHYGLFAATNMTLVAGGSMILIPFDSDVVIQTLPRATAILGVPDLYTKLLADDRFDADRASGIRLFISGAAPLSAVAQTRMQARTGRRVTQAYGLAEAGVIAAGPCEGESGQGAIGPALAGVSLRSAVDGEDARTGEAGILHVKGPNVFQGYWGKPRKTRQAFSPDGWFRTDDLVRIDDAGCVAIVGRTGAAVVSDQGIVGFREIERLLEDIPGILEACLICASHPDQGDTLVALLVPASEGPDLAKADAILTDRLADTGLPRRIEIVESVPKSPMGRIRTGELWRRYAGRPE